MGQVRRREQRKLAKIERMIASLQAMLPGHPNEFVCPICEKRYLLSELRKITYGHIVPKAAGKDLTTLICEPCNSSSGHGIDKWFGDLVRVSEDGKSIFNTSYQGSQLIIDGVRVGGQMRRHEDGSFEVLIYEDRSDPRALDELGRKVEVGLKSIEVTYPLLGNMRLADLGAVQAGYLTLIKAFGYVPMLQKSLDVVRAQLRDTSKDLLGKQFLAIANIDVGFSVGLAQLPGRLCLYAAFRRVIVFYPPCNANDSFYQTLPQDYKTAGVKLHPFRSTTEPVPERAMGLLVSDQMMLWPDKAKRIPQDFAIASLEQPDGVVKFLRGIPEEQFHELRGREDLDIEHKFFRTPPIGL